MDQHFDQSKCTKCFESNLDIGILVPVFGTKVMMIASAKIRNRSNDRFRKKMLSELRQYQDALLNMLSGIDIGNCEYELKDDLKSVYKLLNHIQTAIDEMQSEVQRPAKKTTSKHSAS